MRRHHTLATNIWVVLEWSLKPWSLLLGLFCSVRLNIYLYGESFEICSSNAFLVSTSTVVPYKPTDAFAVTAGTGHFNGSFVWPFLQKNSALLPYWALAATYNFVSNSLFSIPINSVSPDCFTTCARCDSYLLPGGTYLMYPQPQPLLESDEDSTILIRDAPAMQLDFTKGLHNSDEFLSGDCKVYPDESNHVGVEFCLAKSRTTQDSLIAGGRSTILSACLKPS